MANKKKSAKTKRTKFTKQAEADIARLLKTGKKLDLELKDVKRDVERMMMHIHLAPPFTRRKRR